MSDALTLAGRNAKQTSPLRKFLPRAADINALFVFGNSRTEQIVIFGLIDENVAAVNSWMAFHDVNVVTMREISTLAGKVYLSVVTGARTFYRDVYTVENELKEVGDASTAANPVYFLLVRNPWYLWCPRSRVTLVGSLDIARH